MRGRVIEYDPPRRFATTWSVEGMEALRNAGVSHDLRHRADGRQHQLTMTEAHQWEVPDAIARRAFRLTMHPVPSQERA